MNSSDFMLQAIELAKRGWGQVSPNPAVGALLVKDGNIIGQGWHKQFGGPHAEPNAIADAEQAGFSVEGATLYCTLEPCCHTNKKTPPCTQLIISKKIKRVVIGTLDPNPEVAGHGVELLRRAGIEVEIDIEQQVCDELVRAFRCYILKQRSYVHLKVATTLDGRIATDCGDAKWISSELARDEVHRLRCEYDAVLVGRKTVEIDQPLLNVRRVKCAKKTPWRIIVGDHEKLDFSLPLFQEERDKIVLATTSPNLSDMSEFKLISFTQWEALLKDTAKLGITSILVEGGAQVASSVLHSDLVDELTIYSSAKIIGNGPVFFQDNSRQKMEQAINLKHVSVRVMEGEIPNVAWHWRRG